MSTRGDIVPIPPNRVKFFGGEGDMLLPSRSDVSSALAKVAEGTTTSVSALCDAMAAAADVRGACPVTTKSVLREMATAGESTPWWRVINKNRGLLAGMPSGPDDQKRRLQAEGVAVADVSGKPRVTT